MDDKIELNRRMNETLEAMARAIFKDWFVDFGPTRAKAEGRAPYLASELWDLFPDAFEEEDKPVGLARNSAKAWAVMLRKDTRGTARRPALLVKWDARSLRIPACEAESMPRRHRSELTELGRR